MSVIQSHMYFGPGVTVEFDHWWGLSGTWEEIKVRMYRGQTWTLETTFKVPSLGEGAEVPIKRYIEENNLLERAINIFRSQADEKWWKAHYTVRHFEDAREFMSQVSVLTFRDEDE